MPAALEGRSAYTDLAHDGRIRLVKIGPFADVACHRLRYLFKVSYCRGW